MRLSGAFCTTRFVLQLDSYRSLVKEKREAPVRVSLFLSVSHVYVIDATVLNEEICFVIMTAYLKIAIFISTLLLQLPVDQQYPRVVPAFKVDTIQDMLIEAEVQQLSPSVVGAALADY